MIIEEGEHRLSCESIEDVNFNELLDGRKARILYSDPPWGDGNMKYWATIKEKATGEVTNQISFEELLEAFHNIIKENVDGYVFIETGNRWKDQLKVAMDDILFNIKFNTITYNNGKNTNVIMMGTTDPGLKIDVDLNGLSGYEILRSAIGPVSERDGIILDPCCGFGWTAKAAVEFGMIFCGNEFNSERLERTRKVLQ